MSELTTLPPIPSESETAEHDPWQDFPTALAAARKHPGYAHRMREFDLLALLAEDFRTPRNDVFFREALQLILMSTEYDAQSCAPGLVSQEMLTAYVRRYRGVPQTIKTRLIWTITLLYRIESCLGLYLVCREVLRGKSFEEELHAVNFGIEHRVLQQIVAGRLKRVDRVSPRTVSSGVKGQVARLSADSATPPFFLVLLIEALEAGRISHLNEFFRFRDAVWQPVSDISAPAESNDIETN